MINTNIMFLLLLIFFVVSSNWIVFLNTVESLIDGHSIRRTGFIRRTVVRERVGIKSFLVCYHWYQNNIGEKERFYDRKGWQITHRKPNKQWKKLNLELFSFGITESGTFITLTRCVLKDNWESEKNNKTSALIDDVIKTNRRKVWEDRRTK